MAEHLNYMVDLASGPTHRTCWVDRRVQAGQEITLKDSDEPDRLWEVLWVSETGKSFIDLGKQRGWHVGGL